MTCELCKCELPVKSNLTPEVIIEKGCQFLNADLGKLKSKSRRREITEPRQKLMVLLNLNTQLSLKSIGEMFGGRDHTTVIHAKRVVNDLSDTSDYYRNNFKELERYVFS